MKKAVSAASSAAVASGVPVVVDALTSSTQQTSALPDGTMQLEVSSVPVRVEQDGAWVPVDTTLVTDGGWLAPAASAAPVRFSAGGSDQLAQVQTESGEWVTETWPYGTLPAPTVEGDTATYAEVLPGVDLKMVATTTGQASIYVVKTEKAAKSAKLDDLHVLIDGADLTKASTGVVEAEATDGSNIVAGQPLWWDSSEGATFRDPGDVGSPAPVTHDVAADRITMDVGASVDKEEKRAGDDVTYPIFVDPDWSPGMAASWYTDKAYAGTSYLSGNSPVLRVGNYSIYKSDMFFQFPIGALAGKFVTYAVLNTTQLSMDACGTPGAIQVHTYGPKPAGFTWNQEQAWNADGSSGWSAPLQSWVGPGCGSAAIAVGWNVTAGVQGKLGASDIQFGFTPSDPAAPTRRHYDRAATLIVSYNSRPDTPTNPVFTSPSAPCGTASAPTLIGQKDVTVQVNQTDPDGGNVDDNFFLMKASDLNTLVQHRTPGMVAQGLRSVTFNNLTDDTYAWYARGSDWIQDGAAGTAWCYFTVDTVGPTISQMIFSTAGLQIGVPSHGFAKVRTADNVAFVAYAAVGAPASEPFVFDVFTEAPACGSQFGIVRIACPSGVGLATLYFSAIASTTTIWAVAYDKAGNPSPVPGKPLADAGKYGFSATFTAQNHPSVAFGHGYFWPVLQQPSPLGASIPGTFADTTEPALMLGADTLRGATANPIAPNVPIPRAVLSFGNPSNTGLTGADHSSAVLDLEVAAGLTLAAWVKPGTGGGETAVSLGSSSEIRIGASGTNWFFCYPSATDQQACVSAPRSPSAGWVHLAATVDPGNKAVRLYADGALMAIAPLGAYSTVLGANLDVGVTLVNGVVSSRWTGEIADPAFFTMPASQSQLIALRAGQDPANG